VAKRRTERLNSLLKEVISEVIRRNLKNPQISELITVTRVDITKDLRHAKVFISVITDKNDAQLTVDTLQSAAGRIGSIASKKVVMRYFPTLIFILDDSVDKHMRIEQILNKIKSNTPQDQGNDTTMH